MIKKLVERIKADYFAILCDETTDISAIVQLSFCVRFVENNNVYEEFLQFVPVKDCTAAGLATTIIEAVDTFQLESQKTVGQGYDGAGAMSGCLNGAQAIIQQTFKMATYVHCASHSLNLSFVNACKLAQIRNCVGVINSVWEFFRYPKRNNVLAEELEKAEEEITGIGEEMEDVEEEREVTEEEREGERTGEDRERAEKDKPKGKKLKRLNPTRFVERHVSVINFIIFFEYVVRSLERIAEWKDKQTASSATQLLHSICRFEFLISLYVINEVFEITLPLSKYLQTENIDLKLAVDSAMNVKASLEQARQDVDDRFSKLFAIVSALCGKLDIPIQKPRTATRQAHRSNYPAESAEDYFRTSICIPFLDETIHSIETKFLSHKKVLAPFPHLICPPQTAEYRYFN